MNFCISTKYSLSKARHGCYIKTMQHRDIQNQKQFHVKIDKKKVEMTDPIKHLGDYQVKLKIYPSIQAQIKVKVKAQ